MRILLCSDSLSKDFLANENCYSIEAGECDSRRNFDHHGIHSKNPCPGNDLSIQPISVWKIPFVKVRITHYDADGHLGLSRLLGKRHHELLITSIIEKIDVSGSSILDNFNIPEYHFMLGIKELSRSLPKSSKEEVDVTEMVLGILDMPLMEIINIGKGVFKTLKDNLDKCLVCKKSGIGLWRAGKELLDPSMSYQDGTNIVVLYNDERKSISMYSSPFTGPEICRIWCGIQFSGHPRACGTPRDKDFSFEDAQNVYAEVLKCFDRSWE
jgi:hypothetical protein